MLMAGGMIQSEGDRLYVYSFAASAPLPRRGTEAGTCSQRVEWTVEVGGAAPAELLVSPPARALAASLLMVDIDCPLLWDVTVPDKGERLKGHSWVGTVAARGVSDPTGQ